MIKVLVVDDDFMVAKVHSGYVTRTPGFEVVGVAHTGADALRAARQLRPDLVLLDIYLPDMDGLTVLQELRSSQGDTDVIVISAANDVDTVRRAMRGGVLHYLIKPFSYSALFDQLRHFATLHEKLDRLAVAGQADVDQVFGARPRGASTLPKGLTDQTAELVSRVLRQHAEGLSASECAQLTELSRVSARRYLEHFTESGKAEVTLRYGGTGRPERRYRWI
ncbi:response regulator [Kibdelosporangium phytohabitans]|uniref:Transcriptional regulatory protein n=1 Tax=Kibdelosporangium phytohabitans TaxID=860235 RepID=A0A0N9ICW2_9PSEU|nr:response regulator [Kibdelosporangium phytohabitans]ALG14205.1 chemotaxis protein CheY [Kibdelosporangium phytohabitans]MBE1466799.1 response regulator of citrate/malate metabolism [Kibdelosporangium phytohabitans]